MFWRVASPKGSSNARPISWIVVSFGVVAVFLTFASWFILSNPIGSTFHGYFYGVENSASKASDFSVSQTNTTSVDLHMNANLDLVDNKPLADLQPSIVSSGVSSDNSKIEQTDTNSNSEVPFGESASPKIVPVTKEVNGLETSDAMASKAPIPVSATNSSIMKGNIKIEKISFIALMIISQMMNPMLFLVIQIASSVVLQGCSNLFSIFHFTYYIHILIL